MIKTPKLLLWALVAFTTPIVLSSCKKDEDDKFTILSPVAGEYVGAETCAPDKPHEYVIQVYNTAEDNNKVFIDNIYGLSDFASSSTDPIHVKFVANVSGNSITLPDTDQIFTDAGGDKYKVRVGADGTVSDDKITLNFRITSDSTDFLNDTCTFVGSRTYIGPAF